MVHIEIEIIIFRFFILLTGICVDAIQSVDEFIIVVLRRRTRSDRRALISLNELAGKIVRSQFTQPSGICV